MPRALWFVIIGYAVLTIAAPGVQAEQVGAASTDDSVEAGMTQGMRDGDKGLVGKCPHDVSRCSLQQQVEGHYDGFDKYAKWWSVVYHAFLFLGLILTLLAAFLAKFESNPHGDSEEARKAAAARSKRYQSWAPFLVLAAAILTGISTAGGFGGKWKANRHARARLETIRIDVDDTSKSVSSLRDSLSKIIRDESAAVDAAGK